MGIEALPASTVRTIGATQVLNDPASVVKELIDNALDAQSTSISIEIHANTLDSIQVRDSGHGIAPEDRQLVAKPHCTSKIGGEGDLKAIGGTSLGFRGEALASAAEMSGSLTISTRVEGEEVATALKINQRGEVVKQDRASLPVGTTVKITDFIKAHPVRRQVALKAADKTLGKIKQTLKAYAFARPHVRLSLRVIKAKNDKGNWMYAPKAGGNAEDAAFKIVGSACATQCTWSVIEEHCFALQCFLPRPDAEVSKYSNIGSFLSIDARPVSTARGLPKQVLKIFRDTIKKANPAAEGVKEPFFFLEIRCPPASYDANVEPAKDDVLFEDSDMVIGLVRQLFEAVYPLPEGRVAASQIERSGSVNPQHESQRVEDDGFVTSLELAAAEQPNALLTPWTPLPIHRPSRPLDDDDAGNRADTDALLLRPFRSNMYGRDEEDLEIDEGRPQTGHAEADFEELRRDVNLSNPWILAKMNTRIRQPDVDLDDDPSPLRNDSQPVRMDARAKNAHDEQETNGLPTPRPSSPLRGIDTPRAPKDVPNVRMAGDGRLVGAQEPPPPGPTIMPLQSRDLLGDSPVQRRQQPAYNYYVSLNERGSSTDTPLQAIPSSSAAREQGLKKPARQSRLNAPFRSPVKDQAPREQVWFDHLENMDRNRSPKRQCLPPESNGMVVRGELGDLMDDPRALTPPRRNRDMRDFLTLGTNQKDSTAATHGGRRHALQHDEQAQSIATRSDARPNTNEENEGQMTEPVRGQGFVRASELATGDNRFGPLLPDTSRPSKRRKTSERRALKEISGNAPAQDDVGDEECQTIAGGEGTSTRRHETESSPGKSRRRKSSRLPLERVPKGQGTHDLVIVPSHSMRKVSVMAANIDQERSTVGWNEAAVDGRDIFTVMSDTAELEEITVKLHELLRKHVPDGEMVQDLGVVLQGAFAAHSLAALEEDM